MGLPPSIVSKINADLAEILKAPDVLEVLAKQGETPLVSSSDEFRSLLAKDIAKWAQTINAAGIKPN